MPVSKGSVNNTHHTLSYKLPHIALYEVAD